MEPTKTTAAQLLTENKEALFEQLFKSHFKKLHAYARTIVPDEADAEEAVQQVFTRLWGKPETLHLSGSVTAYLYRAVHNECLNYLKHRKVKAAHQHYAVSAGYDYELADKNLKHKELEAKLRKAMAALPEQCRTIFQLSRFEELKYRDIADRLGISVKTVENQMGKALKIMRSQLAVYLTALIMIVKLFKS